MAGLILLVLFQFLGELLNHTLITVVPGPLLGLLLLFSSFHYKPSLYELIKPTSDLLLKHLMLIYIVYGVGLIQHQALLKDKGAWLFLLVILSALCTIILTSLISQNIQRVKA